MAYDYDALYGTTQDALGAPTKVFVDFFAAFEQTNARVLDIGCGQGRDALFIARAGHRVVGVDLSPNGVRDMTEAAAKEGLPVEGIVAELEAFKPDGIFDVLLIDRTLHMLDEQPRLAVLERLIGCVAESGWALIEDERSNIAGLKAVFDAHEVAWETVTAKRGTLFLRRS
jgi:SAM-dependent methyltransferase